jgi:hypothetical protein
VFLYGGNSLFNRRKKRDADEVVTRDVKRDVNDFTDDIGAYYQIGQFISGKRALLSWHSQNFLQKSYEHVDKGGLM